MKRILIGLVFMALLFGMTSSAMAQYVIDYVISDDSTGGDCTQIGVWDPATKTCTFNKDIVSPREVHGTIIVIGSDNITIDGNGHKLTRSLNNRVGFGIYIPYYRTGITVKNLNISNVSGGIRADYNSNINLSDNTISNTSVGIWLQNSSHGNVIGNNMSNDVVEGIWLDFSSWNSIQNNNIPPLSRIYASTNNLFKGNKNIALIVLFAGYNEITENGMGLIFICYSSENEIYNNNFKSALFGGYGISTLIIEESENNKIYNNNFKTAPTILTPGSRNIFNLEMPIGGNYWEVYDDPIEGCYDINRDGVCDSPFYFKVGADYLPWTMQDGWLTPENLIGNAISNIERLLSSGEIANVGIATSLTQSLSNALNAISRGDVRVAENMIQAFINKVEAQSGKNITAESASQLIEAARQIINKL